MTWKQKTIVRILLFIAQMLADDDWAKKELGHISNHITTHRDEAEEGLVSIERTH
jgi:hypothetical protein